MARFRQLGYAMTYRVAAAAASLLMVAGCAAAPSSAEESSGASSNEPAGSGAFEAAKTTTPQSDCSEDAKLVYVVTVTKNQLYSFKPSTLEFRPVASLKCSSDANVSPMSMAIDRQGTAWINYSDGRIYKASTKDGSCVDSGFEPPTPAWRRVNLGFSSNETGGSAETLYLVTGSTTGVEGLGQLAKLDTKTLALTQVGRFSGRFAGTTAELTGTGDGRLFGYFMVNDGKSPPLLSEIDPKTAAPMGEPTTINGASAGMGGAYAFSFWGGDFWFYPSAFFKPSRVFQHKAASDKSTNVVVEDVGGFQIIGAGVSTCAPTTPVVN